MGEISNRRTGFDMTCDQLLNYFAERTRVDDTSFSYPGNEDCVIGAMSQIFYDSNLRPLNHGETRYWAGYGCDIPNGTEFPTTQALFDAPIYGGRSICDRWNEITWHMIDGWMTPEDFDAREGNDR